MTDRDKLNTVLKSLDNSIATYGEELNRFIHLKENYQQIQLVVKENNSLSSVTKEMEFLLDVNTCLLISLLDLGIISKKLLQAEMRWEEIYFVKQSYLTIYEFFKTFASFQQQLIGIFQRESDHPESVLAIFKRIREFKKEHEYDSELAAIRNKTAGHIDKDFVLYHQLITSLDKDKALAIILQLLPILNQLQEASIAIVIKVKTRLDLQLTEALSEIGNTLSSIQSLLKKT